MKMLILSCSMLLSSLAAAEVYQLNIGQHQNLNAGDVAIVNSRGQSSTIVCTGNGGNANLPPRKRYEATVFVPYEKGTTDIYPQQTLESSCSRNAFLPEPKQAISMATAQARENCFADYNHCAPPILMNEQYFYNFVGRGRLGCEVTAFMIGTEPNR